MDDTARAVRPRGHASFDDVLRAAIAERGLALGRLREHLAARGQHVGVSTLSYWQNGERQPTERSLPVVEALEQVLRLAQPDEAYFWATHNGAELDLLLLRGTQRVGVEFKRADSPKVTPSMRIALDDLKLDRLYVVYPGEQRFALTDGIEAVPLCALLN